MEEDSYEKNVVMYVVIGEPRHIAGKKRHWVSLCWGLYVALSFLIIANSRIISLLGPETVGEMAQIFKECQPKFLCQL